MRKINYLFPVPLLLLATFCNAQYPLKPEWVKQVKSSQSSGQCEAWGVDVDAAGNIYWPVTIDSLNKQYDIVCYKYDRNGKPLWNTPFYSAMTGYQWAFSANARDSFLYIGGTTCPVVKPECDMLLMKVNKSTGKLVWSKTKGFGKNGYDEMDGLEVRRDGIYCGGWANTTGTNWDSDIGLWKVNFDGTTVYTNSLGQKNTAEHQDGHFVVDTPFIYVSGMWGGTSFFNLYDGREFAGKFKMSDGGMVDTLSFGAVGSWTNSEDALGMTSYNNDLYFTGYSTPSSASDWQIFVARMDKNLHLKWIKYWGGSGTESARAISIKDGIIYIGGFSNSASIATNGDYDAVLLKYDTAGNYISNYVWGDSSQNLVEEIVLDSNYIYMSGASGDSVLTGIPRSSFLIKADINKLTTGISKQVSEGKLNIYPNPSSGTIEVENPSPMQNVLISISDMNGRIIKNFHGSTGIYKFDIGLYGIPNGVYNCSLKTNNAIFSGSFVIIK